FTEPSPVLHLKAEYVGATSVNLTWEVNDTASASYTYRIEVAKDTLIKNVTSGIPTAEITELIPGTMYEFTVFAVAADKTEGEGSSIRIYTKPSPVLHLKAEYVGVTSVNLTWEVNDTASASYTYRIEVAKDTLIKNVTSGIPTAEITELIPGTMYEFTVFAAAADNKTEGEGIAKGLYTKPSPVLHLKAEYVGATSVNLTWEVNDTAFASYTYRIEVAKDTPIRNVTSSGPKAEITELIPGTMYEFTVFAAAADNKTEGEGRSVSNYTKPSPVLHLKAEYVGVTSVNLTWEVNDTASASYTYRIEVAKDTPIRNVTSSGPTAEITELIPGTVYEFTVFAVAADNKTEGEGSSIRIYT
ncbi:PTPRJ phosphatase, partial [Sclerurus mexicanus]|nr:PTPRJ phosphatase [Sclerurus mexicanus]